MSSKSHKHSQARAAAVAVLYSSDITETGARKIIETGAYPTEGFELTEYAEQLVRGVVSHVRTIDRYLAETSENWALDRMPVVDRAILRLAVYEMLFEDGIPVSVAINEAVELAKAYGGEDDSSRFVNGVLGRIARNLEANGGVIHDASGEVIHSSKFGNGNAAAPCAPAAAASAPADDVAPAEDAPAAAPGTVEPPAHDAAESAGDADSAMGDTSTPAAE